MMLDPGLDAGITRGCIELVRAIFLSAVYDVRGRSVGFHNQEERQHAQQEAAVWLLEVERDFKIRILPDDVRAIARRLEQETKTNNEGG